MKVEKSKGRQFVIGDIHGCYYTFKALLSNLDITADDQVFLVGDYIGKVNRDKKVLKEILSLIIDGVNVYPLRGNHEQNFIDAMTYHHYLSKDFYKPPLKIKKLQPKYIKFLTSLPYYYELDNFYIVHAGFNTGPNAFTDKNSMLEIRNMFYDRRVYDYKKIVFGHQPTQITLIKNALYNNDFLLPIDNGCVYEIFQNQRYAGDEYGNLCCVELNSLELIAQKNIDG